jgi:hypothetical protein
MGEPPKTSFMVYIMDGYAFRNSIGIVKAETDRATMILSPSSIEISFINTTKKASYKIQFDASDLTRYDYNIRDEDGNLYEEYAIAFETEEFFNTTKGIGRRDGIHLYWITGDNRITVHPVKASTKDPGRSSALFVKILNIEHQRVEIPVGYNSEPNIKVQSKDFADICTRASTLKCVFLDIVGEYHRVTFKAILPNNTPAAVEHINSRVNVSSSSSSSRLTNLDEVDRLIDNLKTKDQFTNNSEIINNGISLNIMKREDLMTVRTPISTVKALSKIHNISPPGSFLSFYFAENKPIKIISKIGTYGTCTICLRN